MESATCPQCHAQVPARATFCGSCGSRISQPPLDPTTRLTPPAAPVEITTPAHTPPVDPYAAQYSLPWSGPAQTWPGQPSLPPTEVLGPPTLPQPTPPRRRRRGLLIVSLLLIVLLLGAGGYLAFNLTRQNAANQNGSNAGTSGDGGLSLPSINRQAIYAGANVTIQSAIKAHSFPGFQKLDASDDVVKVKAQIENQTKVILMFFNAVHLLGPDGSRTEPSVTNASNVLAGYFNPGVSAVGYWYFEVSHNQNGVGAYTIILGKGQEVQENVPFVGSYDPSVWQWVTKPIGKSVTYHTQGGGAVVGTVVKVSTGVWTPGYQAPQGMRFILTDMMAANQTPVPVYISGNALKLQAPGGVPESPSTMYGYFINDSLSGGENKDEGYASFVVPPAKGDFILFFYNPDGSVAGQVDLGTL
ncbi:MAG TPA: zinc ribbon domain-containing protein [Ktedonobacterales bacterium]|nr:zinc ribbon domain-containing protein [Ktedonobacterales bacterium]